MEKKTLPLSVNPVFHYASGVQVIFREEEFIFGVTSGSQVYQFVFSPKHAKRLKLLLDKQIQVYEEKYGELKTNLPKNEKGDSSEGRKIGFEA